MPKRGEKLTLQERIRRDDLLTQEQKDKRHKNLLLGQRIRTICCVDALAKQFEDEDSWRKIHAVCDTEMNIVGYESLTDHRRRIDKAINDGTYLDKPRSFFKYQKLPEKVPMNTRILALLNTMEPNVFYALEHDQTFYDAVKLGYIDQDLFGPNHIITLKGITERNAANEDLPEYRRSQQR